MPPPVNPPNRVDAYVASANQKDPVNAQRYWGEMHPAMQKRVIGMGLNQGLWDDPNSYNAKVLRTQMGSTMKNPNDMQFINAANQYKTVGNVPQKLKPLDDNIGFNRATGAWAPNKNDLIEGSPGYTAPPSLAAPTPSPAPMTGAPPGATPAPAVTATPAVTPAVTATPKPATGGTYATSNFPQKKGSHNMTGKQLFKLAFLSKCIEDGLTMEQICERAKQALYFSEKRAMYEKKALLGEVADKIMAGLGWGASAAGTGIGNTLVAGKDLTVAGIGAAGTAAGGLLSTLPWLAGATAIGAPLAAGYYIGGPAAYNTLYKPNLPSREEMMQEELLNEYEKQTRQLKQQSELAKRRKERSKGISGVTRY